MKQRGGRRRPDADVAAAVDAEAFGVVGAERHDVGRIEVDHVSGGLFCAGRRASREEQRSLRSTARCNGNAVVARSGSDDKVVRRCVKAARRRRPDADVAESVHPHPLRAVGRDRERVRTGAEPARVRVAGEGDAGSRCGAGCELRDISKCLNTSKTLSFSCDYTSNSRVSHWNSSISASR